VLDVGIGWTAHEFRSPVLAARSAIDHVLEDAAELGEGTNRALLLRARSELGYLAELVEPLLSWAAGSGKLLRRRTDVVRVVREAVASCTGDPRDDRVTIEAPDRLPGWVDGGQLRCAIANVVRNALAYSPADTGVSVTVGVDHDDASICVRDLGLGVSPEQRKEIFEPFARGTAGASRRSGRGLGLFIAKRILEAHGGTITVASEGRRTSFCMRVPLERRVRRWTS
jgi:signal transduction histidine kinase